MEAIDFDKRAIELGIELPSPPAAYGSYLPTLISGTQLYVSGQVSTQNGELRHTGKLGESTALESVREAARLCGINILAQVRSACGGTLNRVTHCIRLTGYVNASPTCQEQAEAMEGCSRLMHQVFGEAGKHTRTTVGVASLPFNASIEVDAIFQIDALDD
jgi:enamine deaminase RidA (YjgF/YER057c/UK114 family)